MKKTAFSVLIISNIIVLCGFLTSYVVRGDQPDAQPVFIVEYTKGKLWDDKKDFSDQKHARFHSDYLHKLRVSGQVRFGARYADKGIVFVSANDFESARKLVEADSAVINKLFNVSVNELNVFYDYAVSQKKPVKAETGRVTGVGGIFFKSKDPKASNAWYYANLGLVPNEYGSMFEWKGSDDGNVAYTQWSPFSSKTKYFNPSKASFMINYRVDDLQALHKKLKANNVVITDTIESYDYGKFLHILDCDSNKIELWQPIDASFQRLYEGKTTK